MRINHIFSSETNKLRLENQIILHRRCLRLLRNRRG